MEPKVFKADPQAIDPSNKDALNAINVLSKFAWRGRVFGNYPEFKNGVPTSPEDEVIVYEDRFERKIGDATQTVFFKDVTSIKLMNNPSSGKLMSFGVYQGAKDTVIFGMQDMEGLLATIGSHLSPSIISQKQMWERSNGFKLSPWIWVLIILLLVMVFAVQYLNK